MQENIEKPSFTFFAFLPPYFGVSGSLVSGMRKSVKRSIDWYQQFLISWLAARYSAVFVFYCTQSVKIDFLKFNLLPNEPIESFWDALGLGIEPFLCSRPVQSRPIPSGPSTCPTTLLASTCITTPQGGVVGHIEARGGGWAC